MIYQDIIILKANSQDRNLMQYTSECLQKIVNELKEFSIKVTEGFTSKRIGKANNFRIKDNKLICDININDGLSCDCNKVYPACLLKCKPKIKENKKDIIKDATLILIGLCDNNADETIKPIIIQEEK